MASLEQIDLGRVVSELAAALHRAELRRKHVERLLDRIEAAMDRLGLDCVRLGDVVVRAGEDGELVYPADPEGLARLDEALSRILYYRDMLEEAGRLLEYLPDDALEKAELVKQHLDRLLESLKCREV